MTDTDLLEYVRRVLSYDPVTGMFTWNERVANRVRVGDTAGSLNKAKSSGYWQISIRGKLYQAHRLAWFYVHGEWPRGQIDHINGVRHDNRLDNLRDVKQSINQLNVRLPRRDSQTGYKGVRLQPNGRFNAFFSGGGRRVSLGSYATPEEAAKAYLAHRDRTLTEVLD